MKLWPWTSLPLRTTARITALSPGQSPPPVKTPIRMRRTLALPGVQTGAGRADDPAVRPALLTVALVVGLLGVPGQAGATTAGQQGLDSATATATALALSLDQQAAHDGGLRVALERLARDHDRAQARLDARVRLVWTARRPDPLGGLTSRLAATGLRRLTDAGAAAAVRVDRRLVDDVAAQSAATTALRARAVAERARLATQVAAAFAAQDQARQLLTLAEQELAVARAASVEADRERLAMQGRRLAATRAALDTASAVVTTALSTLTPAQTRRSRAARAAEAPVIGLVEAAGAGYPTGYDPSGQVLAGPASWYGPGFVGSPTATGAPYDPERLTCAHKTLPLGTVVRVLANGRAVSCLINDRGPFVGDRILDMSRAGSRMLGYDGVQQVVIEVLTAQTSSPSR